MSANRRSKRGLAETSYWPGYVDALVNVVLNILFLVGLMAIALVTLNTETANNRLSADQALVLHKRAEENMLLAALGTLVRAQSVHPTAPRDSVVDKLNIPTVTPAIAASPVPAKSQPEEATLIPVGMPLTLLPESQELSFIQAKGALSDLTSSPVVLDFLPLFFTPSATHVRQLEQLHTANDKASHWLLLVTVPDRNEHVRRQAFWRLNAVRQQLLELGVPASRVQLRTLPQESNNFSNGRRVFVALRTIPF